MLNPDKCAFSKQCLTFLGHIINQHSVSPDPSKTAAVLEMETPKSLTELRRFMGMVNQLGKFTPNIAELSQPLRELLSSKRSWVWGPAQDAAFKASTPGAKLLLLRGHRIVVPRSLQQETLHKIHSGHQGILRCRLRVSSAVWWPGIKHQVEQLVRSCPACTQASLAHRQPMISSPLPNHPWEKVASDLFELHGKT